MTMSAATTDHEPAPGAFELPEGTRTYRGRSLAELQGEQDGVKHLL